jgi:pilus assembly protein Flp/PilA
MFELITTFIRSLRDDEEGQAMVEYALIVGLVSIAGLAALVTIGPSISSILTAVSNALTSAVPAA